MNTEDFAKEMRTMHMTNKELTIRQIGEFCTNTLCKKCPVAKWDEESNLHNRCMESLRLPEVSRIMLEQIKGRKVERDGE
jgi:hypothetical protein